MSAANVDRPSASESGDDGVRGRSPVQNGEHHE